ncbi:ABC transporter substrate-binding protein [Frankia sp. AgB1.9]|uniref:ABC transporter substrate-binding protein n=1 Tax=unclassified Frankia TaxID=2632575 RepID=UPI0019339492|nr:MULTISPECIES: ABC transporter substrate-binding protein [unclassified Frankia]MBL7489377.1 ABC transporter substrate-binding protein [Frankia sp. AgW1.1]MBL7548686.1 ABC transporter substrate-binding protein [Frankia sp. AgB1.9]MBL7619284.1 ABC transporter substrate-binding protein [Frankia sp. AgB1.8]
MSSSYSDSEFVERMFPEPADHGIAEPDRAVSNVVSGTDSPTAGDATRWYEGGGRIGEKAHADIVVYPPSRGLQTQGDAFEPVKIGLLMDIENGQLIFDWVNATILAFEDALNEGIYDRPVRLVIADARGLPRENFQKARTGYEWLCDQGCVVVIGPEISDNSLSLQELVNRRKVPVLAWTGAWRFASEYCFTIANGDIPTEAVMCAQWLKAQGHSKVGMFWEQGSSGRDYAGFFRDECNSLGLTIARDIRLGPNPRGLTEHLRSMREDGITGLYYGGYGYSTFHFAEAFKALDWDPPRVMGTAFMFYSNTNRWAEGLEGWHGIDQLGVEGTNPNYEAMVDRFAKRFGRVSKNVVVALGYDTARVAIHGVANAAMATPEEVKEGIERIRWMPATNGGPATYIQFGPWDHKGYKGDFLTIRELRGGELRFDGYHRPQHLINSL